MQLPDVNVLVYAHRLESPEHERYAEFLSALARGPEPFGLSELGASRLRRIVNKLQKFGRRRHPPQMLSSSSNGCAVGPR